jgi:hypothetical protein
MITRIMSKDGGSMTVNLNRRKAIREKCLNCVGWEVHRVNGCDDSSCQLYPFRTGTGKQNAGDRSRAIREYCRWCTNGQIGLCVVSLCPLYAFRKSGIERAPEAVSFPENDDIETDFEREAEVGDITPRLSGESA